MRLSQIDSFILTMILYASSVCFVIYGTVNSFPLASFGGLIMFLFALNKTLKAIIKN